MRLLWPHQLYRYSEDVALGHLVRHGYDVEMALSQLVVDVNGVGQVLNERDSHLERVIQCNEKLDKDIEHSFFSTRKGKVERKANF